MEDSLALRLCSDPFPRNMPTGWEPMANYRYRDRASGVLYLALKLHVQRQPSILLHKGWLVVDGVPYQFVMVPMRSCCLHSLPLAAYCSLRWAVA